MFLAALAWLLRIVIVPVIVVLAVLVLATAVRVALSVVLLGEWAVEGWQLIGFLGWSVAYVNMLIFFASFRLDHEYEYTRLTNDQGFALYCLNNSGGAFVVHRFVCEIAENESGRYSDGLESYAKFVRAVNRISLALLLGFLAWAIGSSLIEHIRHAR